MNRTSNPNRGDHSRGSLESEFVKSNSLKRRKTSKIGGVFRKLFGRKSIKSQISLPTPTRHSEHNPNQFITSADTRFQRSVSMPIDHISRNSALGSHAPFANLSKEQFEYQPQPPVERRLGRTRRATLPSVFVNPADTSSDHTFRDGRIEQEAGQVVDPSNIGFAVTSGSNPKRRSRSADALYDVVKAQHRVSVVHQRHESSRSEEIKYWRYSVGPVPTFDIRQKDDVSSLHEETNQTQPEITEEEEEAQEETSESTNSVNRGTFDFGVLASTMQKQEDISIEERVVTLEVKLMDLEYAISKIQANQANAPLSTGPSPQHLQPTATPRKGSPVGRVQTPSQPFRRSPQSDSKPHQGNEPTASNTLTTQPNAEVSTPSKPSEVSRSSPARPTSTATTVRGVEASSNPSPSPKPDKRASITTLTIDHYSTLISLIRREQAARKLLEEQVYDLRREVQALKGVPSVNSSLHSANGSLYRTGWSNGQESRAGARRIPSFDDVSTEDGYQDVFETPIEQQRREFEGGVLGRVSGEAF